MDIDAFAGAVLGLGLLLGSLGIVALIQRSRMAGQLSAAQFALANTRGFLRNEKELVAELTPLAEIGRKAQAQRRAASKAAVAAGKARRAAKAAEARG